jgi:hypothetical protein
MFVSAVELPYKECHVTSSIDQVTRKSQEADKIPREQDAAQELKQDDVEGLGSPD